MSGPDRLSDKDRELFEYCREKYGWTFLTFTQAKYYAKQLDTAAMKMRNRKDTH